MRPQKQPLHGKCDFLTSRSKGDSDVDAFIGKQVYLDIKNHKASALIEDVLKRLGAVLHIFLGDEVNLIVTDRKEWIAGSSGINSNSGCQIVPKSTGSLQLFSKTSPTIQPLEGKAEYHVKSRVGEMLNRAKSQSTEETVDPLDLAVRKGITILSLAEAQDLVNKLLGTAFNEVRHLNAPFIKLDFSRGNYLPLFKEFSVGWPTIKINCSGSPFTGSSGSVRGRENKIEGNVTQETCLDKYLSHSKLKVLKESSFPSKCCNNKTFNKLGIQTSGNTVNCNVSISSSICDVANVTTSSNKLNIGDPNIFISPKGTAILESTARVPVSEISDSSIQILSKCNASVILTEELKYDTVLSMPVRPNISGKLLLFLPELGSPQVVGEIHIVLNGSDPVVPSKVALTKQAKFHSVPVYDSKEYDIFARTGGTSIWISNNTSSRGNKHLNSLTNSSDNHSNFHRIRNVENINLVRKEKDSAHESTIHSVTVSIISGSSDFLPGNRVLMQISLPNSSSAHYLEITVITSSIKCFYCENNINVNIPLIDIGLLEILLCHLVSSVTQKEIEEWCNSRESKNIQYASESFLKKKSNSIIFELVFPELTEIDSALSTLVVQGINELLMKGEYTIKSQSEYQGKFNFNYLVRYFTDYTDCKKEFIPRGKPCYKSKANSFKEIVSQSTENRTVSESVLASAPQSSLRSPNGHLHQAKKLKYYKCNVRSSKNECLLETKVGRKLVISSNAKVIGSDFNIRSKSSAKKRDDSSGMRKPQEGACITESDVYSNVVSGFCQICCCNYSCLTKHLKEQQHIDFVKNSVNFMELDQSIFEVNRSSIFGQRQGMLYGDSRRSLRSDKTACDSNNQMTTGTNNWKSLPSSKRTSLPPVSNGHHLRSKSVENSPKLSEEYNTIEAQCNGITSSHHSYGTRYGAKLTEHSNVKLTPSRKCSNWDECFDGRFSNNRVSSSPVVNSSESSQLTCASDLGHALRSRHVWFSNNIASETNELEYENEQINAKSDNHSSLDKDYPDCKADCVVSDVTVPKVTNKEQKGYRNPESKHFNNQTMKRKRLTAEEKLIEDNKAYYKLEVKNSKLRSSGYYLTQTDPSICVAEESVLNVDFTTETTVNCNGEQNELSKFKVAVNEKVEPVAEVKRNKIRLSELSLLNNEAENFMFGEPSRSYDSEDDSSNGSQNFKIDGCHLNSSHDDVTIMYKDCGKEPNISVKDKKLNGDALNDSHTSDFKCDVSYKLSCDYNHTEVYSNGVNGSQKRHRRKTHNDASLNDSRDFIKCEEVVSKVSTQTNAYSNSSLNMPNKLESEPTWSESQEWTRNDSDSTAVKYESSINVNTSSSECDSREQKNIAISKAATNLEKKAPNMTLSDVKAGALTVLHFSFEAIPESEPWYQTYQRQDEGEEYYLSGVNDCMYWKSFLLPYEMPHDRFTSVVSSNSAPKCTNTGPMKRRKRKGNSNLLDKKPRKSPRCHASTLAILSSLMHHRKRKESDKVKEELFKSSYCGNETTDAPLPEKQNGTDLGKDVHDVTLNIDQLFGMCTDVGLQSDNQSVQANDDKCVKCVKSKSLKCKRTHKSLNSSNSKKYEIDNLSAKDCEGIDIDPAVFEELVGRGENPLNCIDDLTLRNRGGPSMDVISLLNGYSSCCCVDELRNKDMPRCDSSFQSSSFKESYNSSECASSTCETVQYSDLTDNVRVRGKKRKRKKNLTGWPVEKQKLKRRLMLKLARPEMHSSGIERNSKIKEGCDQVSEDNIACEINKEKCVEVEGCSSGLVTNSETSDSLNARHGSISSEVCVENLCGENHPEVRDVEGREILIDKISPVDHINSCAAIASVSTTEKFCSTRTASIDSNSQHCDFQPRVRVKKMNNVSTLNFVIKTPANVSSVNNSRRLRSTSYLPSGTLRKKQFYGCGDKMEIVRRASARMKKSCSRWDSWSTRRRR